MRQVATLGELVGRLEWHEVGCDRGSRHSIPSGAPAARGELPAPHRPGHAAVRCLLPAAARSVPGTLPLLSPAAFER
jgi:hypothetical protein